MKLRTETKRHPLYTEVRIYEGDTLRATTTCQHGNAHKASQRLKLSLRHQPTYPVRRK